MEASGKKQPTSNSANLGTQMEGGGANTRAGALRTLQEVRWKRIGKRDGQQRGEGEGKRKGNRKGNATKRGEA